MSDKPVYENHGSYDFSKQTTRPAQPINKPNRVPQSRGSVPNNNQVRTARPIQQGQIKRPVRSAYPINDNPINVSYDMENECWLLNGSLDDPEDVVTYTYNSEDGTYEVYESTGDVYITGYLVYALIKTDGTVLAVWIW
jgi:hypothetical protein